MPTPANALDTTSAGLVRFDGTNAFSGVTTTNHDVLIGAASNGITSVGPGSAGQVLQSGGASADPTYSTATYPATAGTSGKILISDGTNIVSSTPTFPNASAASGKFIQSDGTNWIASTPTLPTTAGTTSTLLRSDGTNFVNTSGFTVGSTGIFTSTTQPSLFAYVHNTGTNATGDGTTYTVIFDTVAFQQGANYNTATGVYTIPTSGIYCMTAVISMVGMSALFTLAELNFVVNGTILASRRLMNPGVGSFSYGALGTMNQIQDTIIDSLSASNTIQVNITVSGSTKTISTQTDSLGPFCYFSICKIA